MPLILNGETVHRLFGIEPALECASQAFTALADGKADMPQRLAIRVPEHQGTQLSMPCYVAGSDEALSIKVATVFEQNPCLGLPTTLAFLLLQDPKTGELLALMDAEHLTAMRTAAGSALATQVLAAEDARTLTIFGAGGQAEAHLRAMLHVRPIERIYVCARSLESASRFCKRDMDAEMIPTEDGERAVREADVICCATNSADPLFDGEWLKQGAHVNAIGAFRPDMRELDETTIHKAQIVVDQREAAQKGAGDLIQANVSWDQVIELGELLLKRKVIGPNQITVFKSVGLAVQDALAARYVYEQAQQAGLGMEFNL